MRFFFIDLENVRSEGLEGVSSLSDSDMVFIYYSENAMNLSIPTLENLNNSRASKKFIKTNYIGKNAMDFQIVSLFGAMIERNRQGSYYIISQDNGFRSAVSFCESYFEDYGITCGVYPTIISAITAEMKNSLKNAPAKMAEVSEKLRQAAEKGPEELENAKKENPDFIECQVDGYHGKTLLFVWKANQDIFPEEFYRGLIVDAEDEEAVEDARTRFNEKAFTI